MKRLTLEGVRRDLWRQFPESTSAISFTLNHLAQLRLLRVEGFDWEEGELDRFRFEHSTYRVAAIARGMIEGVAQERAG